MVTSPPCPAVSRTPSSYSAWVTRGVLRSRGCAATSAVPPQAELGAAIIVDNGVFDLGRALPAADQVRAARAVHAQGIILPDMMHDGPATIRASDLAAAQILRITDKFRLCAVVRAADDPEWNHVYDHFASRDYIGAVAFPASRSRGRAGSCRRTASPRPRTWKATAGSSPA